MVSPDVGFTPACRPHPPDRRPEDQSAGPAGQVQEARPEEGAHVRRRHAPGPAGRQTQGDHGPEVQPEAGQEGGQGGGERRVRRVREPEKTVKVLRHFFVTMSSNIRYQ